MNGGYIMKNTATTMYEGASGGGVYVSLPTYCRFAKNAGVIYGYDGGANANKALATSVKNDPNYRGSAVAINGSGSAYARNKTAGATVILNSTTNVGFGQ
jgi:hypothetical protein